MNTIKMEQRIKEMSTFAIMFMDDGALVSAARVLEELAIEVRAFADEIQCREFAHQAAAHGIVTEVKAP